MAVKIKELSGRASSAVARHPRARKIAIWLVSIVAFIGIVATAAPPLLKSKIAAELSESLHRNVSIEEIWFNPLALSLTVRGFVVQERQGSGLYSRNCV
jgi:hypothetical protein